MLKLNYSRIESYIDNIPLTKQSRIEYEKQCRDIIDVIKKTMDLGFKTSSDAGAALRTIDISKFKTSIDNQSKSLNQLKSFLIHIGYENNSASCVIRSLNNNILSIRAKKIIENIKDL